MSKQIDIYKDIVISGEWLDAQLSLLKGLDDDKHQGMMHIITYIKQNSTPLLKVCEVVYDAGMLSGEDTYKDHDCKRYDKLKQDFLNSKINL